MQTRFHLIVKFAVLAVSMFSFGTYLSAQQTLCQQMGQNFSPTLPPIGTDQFSETTSSSLGVSGWTNQKVVINGTFKITSNFNISQCTLKMGTNAKILIEGSNSFSSWGSYYFHCGSDFWGGIITEYGSTSQVTVFGNHIEDADKSMTIRSGGNKAWIVGNLFNRNFTGVYAWAIPVNAFIALNLFDCTSSLNSGVAATSGYAGIFLDACPAASIGLISNNAPNDFRHQQFGIRLYNTTAFVGLSDFSNNGTGIWGDYSNINLRGINTTIRSNFLQNNYDIETSHSNLSAFYCKMENCTHKSVVSINNSLLERIYIADNVINMNNNPSGTRIGIQLHRSAGGSDDQYRNIIERNHITINDFGGQIRTGIYVNGAPNASDFLLVDDNTIDVFKGGNGNNPFGYIDIYGGASDNKIISNNILRSHNTFSEGAGRWGIYVHTGNVFTEGNFIAGNRIFGNGVFDGGCCAIHAVNSGSWTVCNNTTDHTYRGLHFMGVCGQSRVAENTIIDHNFYKAYTIGEKTYEFIGTGLLIQGNYEDNGFIGDQVCSNNYWEMPEYSTQAFAAQILGNENQVPSTNTILMNQFFVEDINDEHSAPPDRDPADDDWFDEGQCPVPLPSICVSDDVVHIPSINEHDIRVINNYHQVQVSPEAKEWEATCQVMKKLMRYPQLLVNAGSVNSFYETYRESSAGRFARFDSMLNAAIIVSSAYQSAMNIIEDSIGAKQAEITVLDASVTNFSNPDINFFDERASLLAQLNNFSVQRTALRSQILAVREPLLLICEQFNAALPENEIYEQNQKFLNTLVIKYSRGIAFLQTDYEMLHEIAQQCYEIAWHTRDRAISMLPISQGSQYLRENPEYTGCEEERDQTINSKVFSINIYPNPATDKIRVEFEKPFSGNLTITDLSGKEVLMLLDVSEKHTMLIPTEKLPNGIYVLSGNNSSENLPFVRKFAIVR